MLLITVIKGLEKEWRQVSIYNKIVWLSSVYLVYLFFVKSLLDFFIVSGKF